MIPTSATLLSALVVIYEKLGRASDAAKIRGLLPKRSRLGLGAKTQENEGEKIDKPDKMPKKRGSKEGMVATTERFLDVKEAVRGFDNLLDTSAISGSEVALHGAVTEGVRLCACYLDRYWTKKKGMFTPPDLPPLEGVPANRNHQVRSYPVYAVLESGVDLLLKESDLPSEEWLRLMIRTCQALLKSDRPNDCFAIAHRAASCDRLQPKPEHKQIFQWLKVLGGEGSDDVECNKAALATIKILCGAAPDNIMLANKLHQLMYSISVSAVQKLLCRRFAIQIVLRRGASR